MGKKIQDMPTSTLLSYQQILGSSNEMMDKYATLVDEMVKEKTMDQEFLEKVMTSLGPKVNKNSDYIDEIDAELIFRIQRDLPGSMTSKVMTTWYERLREAQVAFAKKSEKKPEEKPVFKMDKRKKK